MGLTEGTAAPASPLYHAASGRPRLRVSVILATQSTPAWLDETLAAAMTADFLDVQILRTGDAPARRKGSLAWQAYLYFDRALLGELAPIMSSRPLRPVIAAAPMLVSSEALRTAVAEFKPDVVLSVGHSPAPANLSPLARLASWSLPAESCSATFALLHLLPAFAQGQTHALSGFSVFDEHAGHGLLLDPAEVSVAQLSFSRNAAYQLQKAPAQLLRELRRLHQGEPLRASALSEPRPPRALATLSLCWRIASRSALRHLPRIGRRERWTLAARRDAPVIEPSSPSADNFAEWTPPRGWFWADPFPWLLDGRKHVFFEAFNYARAIGEIHAVEVDAEGQPGQPVVVMRGPHHLSYPFLFTHDNELHLLVECAQSRRIDAFRAMQYPSQWEPVATLLSGWRAVDGTLLQHEGRWWLFACVAETPFDDGGREFNELFLFYSDSALGPWTPHRQNPVVSDVRSARPAGPLFVHSGRLIRPSQDCAREYGHRIVFNQITRLDTEHYEESALSMLNPDWAPGLRGCHTYARCDGLEVIDVKQLVPVRKTLAQDD